MQENQTINRENISRYPCRACGSNLVFDPGHQSLLCTHCGYTEAVVNDNGRIQERSYQLFLQPDQSRFQTLAREAMQVGCDSCGAIVTFTPPEIARECDFCAAKIVAQPKAADPLVAPEGVLPFAVTQQQATVAFNDWLGSLWFAPGNLKELARGDKNHSVYIPYWTYDAYTNSDYRGERGEHYYETERYAETDSEGRQQQRERRVQKTRWYPAYGSVSRQFDDVTVPATVSLPAKYLECLRWDFANLVPYEPAYLAGHKAQTYQVALEAGFERFKTIAAGFIYEDARRDIGGDAQQVHNVSTEYSNITFKHLLLPVYAGAYRFNDKVYQIVINGRTGEVQGDRPYSYLKIGCLVIAIVAALLFAALVFSAVRR